MTFGRAPFAFYVAHLYLLHAGSIVLGMAQGFEARQFLTVFQFFPKGYGFGLPGVYLVWVLVVLALYPLCRWVGRRQGATARLVAQLLLGLSSRAHDAPAEPSPPSPLAAEPRSATIGTAAAR